MRQPRLHVVHSWVSEDPYVQNRLQPFTLAHGLKSKKQRYEKAVDSCAWEQNVDLSRVDVSVLATAMLMEYPVASDDTGLRDIALILEVETMGSVELLRFFVDHGRLDLLTASTILDYLKSLPDLPASFRYDCGRYFPELNS